MNEPHETIFPDLPDEARLWIVALDGAREDLWDLLSETQLFLEQWTSHGRSIQSEIALKSNRFLLIAGIIPGGTISGCGIDALMRAIDEIAVNRNCSVLSSMLIYYRMADGTVDFAPRSQFRNLVNQGLISPETPVFNPGIYTLNELRMGNFELPLVNSVYARVFQLPAIID
ncbi:MAG: hypothetical protein OXE92_03330 [Bacteroidetes bacterium]|nr:hypothetical protein [Bacteroidota bacterium]MCY4204740.1 hypothetical protein [Bacteroidota bacterium]